MWKTTLNNETVKVDTKFRCAMEFFSECTVRFVWNDDSEYFVEIVESNLPDGRIKAGQIYVIRSAFFTTKKK